jgi:hypothetical protein
MLTSCINAWYGQPLGIRPQCPTEGSADGTSQKIVRLCTHSSAAKHKQLVQKQQQPPYPRSREPGSQAYIITAGCLMLQLLTGIEIQSATLLCVSIDA